MLSETYWINRPDVIGMDVLKDMFSARQLSTYMGVAQTIIDHDLYSVLDIGCNVAAMRFYLDALGYEGVYVGLDSNPHALSIAQVAASVTRGNLRALPFPDRAFGGVIVKDVIEHLEGLAPLAEAFRVTRKALVLACYIPFCNGPSQIVKHPDGYYTNTYNLEDVIVFAWGCGFELAQAIQTQEANGTPNEITIWERVSE